MKTNDLQINVSVSGRYAKALFKTSKELGIIEKITKDIAIIEDLLKKEECLKDLFLGNFLKNKQAEAIFFDLKEAFSFNEVTLNFLKILSKNKRLNIIFSVIKDFFTLIDNENDILNIKLEVFKKHPALLNAIQKFLKEKFKSKNYRFSVKENHGLISGFKAFIGSNCFDYSLKGRLNRMQQKLKEVQQ